MSCLTLTFSLQICERIACRAVARTGWASAHCSVCCPWWARPCCWSEGCWHYVIVVEGLTLKCSSSWRYQRGVKEEMFTICTVTTRKYSSVLSASNRSTAELLQASTAAVTWCDRYFRNVTNRWRWWCPNFELLLKFVMRAKLFKMVFKKQIK